MIPHESDSDEPKRKRRTAETSKQAYREVRPKIPLRKQQIIAAIRNAKGVGKTREELAADLRIKESSVCCPVRKLLDDGTVVESGRTRTTSCDGKANVLVLPEYLLANPFVPI